MAPKILVNAIAPGYVKTPLWIDTNEEEFERIKKTGAKVIKEPYNPGEAPDMLIATFADPDGNYFQLMSPWEEETSKSN